MNLITSILAISIAMVLYIALIEIFAVLFRITGLTKEKAKFQVISMIGLILITMVVVNLQITLQRIFLKKLYFFS
jgi:hypothetical protein